jgi:hypothetical protein
MVQPLKLGMTCWSVGWMILMFGGKYLMLVKSPNEVKDSLTELRVICTVAGQRGKLMSHPHGHIMIHWNQLKQLYYNGW